MLGLLMSLLGVMDQIKHAVILAADSIDADAGSKIRLDQANQNLAKLQGNLQAQTDAVKDMGTVLDAQLVSLRALLDKTMPESDRRELLTRIANVQSSIIENTRTLKDIMGVPDANIQGLLAARTGIWAQLAPNIFSPGPGTGTDDRMGLGSSRPDQVTVNQYFTQTPNDPFVWFRKSAFAARGAF
jgi:hypothetical protein